MYNPFSLEGKTILVTGASSGIGRATAIECSKLGATVVVTARNEQRLRATYDSLSGEGHVVIIADLSDDNQLDNLVDNCPSLDGLVNNAGITETIMTPFIKRDKLMKVMETNTFAPILLTQRLLT
jgi:NAD(P)-dependent dehydrogenase (short-subunit alcohol dehydrogenase family)